jgi:DNA-binding NarL/FixJ family response regulator
MINNNTYDQIDVLLIDTDLNARQGVRTILSNNGFSGVTLGTDLAKVRDAITRRMPDLLLCGTEFPDGKITDLIRDIRHLRTEKGRCLGTALLFLTFQAFARAAVFIRQVDAPRPSAFLPRPRARGAPWPS